MGQGLIEVRKATLASVLAKAGPGIRFNEHLDYDDGAAVFQHACKMGLEGIVSKPKDSLYRARDSFRLRASRSMLRNCPTRSAS
jgi:bifunctional non-homologous end joining protein LigD